MRESASNEELREAKGRRVEFARSSAKIINHFGQRACQWRLARQASRTWGGGGAPTGQLRHCKSVGWPVERLVLLILLCERQFHRHSRGLRIFSPLPAPTTTTCVVVAVVVVVVVVKHHEVKRHPGEPTNDPGRPNFRPADRQSLGAPVGLAAFA